MFELEKDDFYIVESLLRGKEGYLIPESVIRNNNPGWVFVDSQTYPQITLIWSHGIEGLYLVGSNVSEYSKELNHFIASYLKPKLLSIGVTYLEISGIPPVKDIELQNILESFNFESWEQSKYIYGKKDINTFALDNNLYNIKDIIENENSLKNIDLLKKVILSYWDTIDIFIDKADGYCIIIDNVIASWAITAWISKNKHEPRIDTIEKYRQKGYGKICSSAIVNCYLKKGYTPYWECEKTNIASAKIANNIGFSKLFDYNCYGFSISD